MLTDNKEITTAAYWNALFTGKRNNTKQDASNNIRPKNYFDRFGWVAEYAEGPNVLGIGSGHAHCEKRIKAKHPDWNIIASDQASEAIKVANFEPYFTFSCYEIPFADKMFDTVMVTNALEYFEYLHRFLTEAKRVGKYFLASLPLGEEKLWSQLYIFTEENVKELLRPYGTIEEFKRHDDLLLVKLKFL